MRVTFLGGAQTVTGSKYLVESDSTRLLVDCGLFQGFKWLRRRNWQPLPLGINDVDAVVLSHAHLDHSGYVPLLYKHGFRGKVYAHHATVELCGLLWPDSGHIQEEDAKFLGKHRLSKHEKPEPLYDQATAEAALKLFHGVEFKKTFRVGDIEVELRPVGHLLGAASVILSSGGQRIGFSGDVGRPNDILMTAPEPLPELDLLMLESTYGDRLHPETEDPYDQLAAVVNEAASAGGVLLIPSFSVGRAQLLQHLLTVLMATGKIPKMPIYLDSPMAISATEIYQRHHQYHKLSAAECQQAAQQVTYTRHVDESKAIADQLGPHIIIAGSGMATGGRILHHFKHWLGDHRSTVLFAGHQAGGTRGAKLQQGVPSIKVHGSWLPVKARIRSLEGLSGHADYSELTAWLKASSLRADTPIQLVHGDPEALEHMRDHLMEHTNFKVDIAEYMQVVHSESKP